MTFHALPSRRPAARRTGLFLGRLSALGLGCTLLGALGVPQPAAAAPAPGTSPTFVGSAAVSVGFNTSTANNIKGALHASDVDAAQTLTWTVTTAPTYGVLSSFASATASSGSTDITPGGTLTYTPPTNFSGIDTFVVQVGDGTATASRTVTVTVGAPPAYAAATGSGTGVNITAIGYCYPFGGSPVTVSSFTNQDTNTSLRTIYRGQSDYGAVHITNTSGGTASYRSAVWADFNNDGTFATDERRWTWNTDSLANNNPSNTSTSGVGFIPINFPATTLKLRWITRLGTTLPGPYDTGYTGEYLDAYVTIAANTAPTLNTGLTVVIPDVVSTDTDPAGVDIKSMMDDAGTLITDPDPAASGYQGIALTGATGTGTWQYGVQDNTTYVWTWTTISSPSDTAAVLLPKSDTTRLRFVPSAAGSFSMTFRAWDQTQGSSHQVYDITGHGGTGAARAFSTATKTVTATSHDAATGGTSKLYLSDASLGRLRTIALTPATGAVLPPKAVPSTRSELAGGDRASYDATNGYIYWKDYAQAYRVKPDGTGFQQITNFDPDNGPYMGALALNGSELRVVAQNSSGTNIIYGSALTSPATLTNKGSLADGRYYDHLAWDGTSLFASWPGSPYRLVKAGNTGASETILATLTTNYNLHDIDYDSTKVFWLESYTTTRSLRSVAKAGGSPTTLASLPGTPSALRVDATNGFFYIALSAPATLYRADYPSGANLTKLLNLGFNATGIDLQLVSAAPPDTTPPTVVSVVRQSPSGSNLTPATTAITFRVTYSEAVTGVVAANFQIENLNGGSVVGTIGSISTVSTSVYDVPVTVTGGSGEFRLKVTN